MSNNFEICPQMMNISANQYNMTHCGNFIFVLNGHQKNVTHVINQYAPRRV